MTPPTHHVVLYARAGCHLCDVARATVTEVRARFPFSFEEIDIDRDDALVRAYAIRVPVVTVDGEEAFEVEVPAEAFTMLVRM